MNSMTGFGVSRREVEGWEIRVEVQTLNGRFLSTRLHLPEEVRDLTPEIETRLKAAFARGTVHCRVGIQAESAATAPAVDVHRLEALCRSVQEVRRRLGLTEDVTPEWLLALPGVAGQLAAAGPGPEALESEVLATVDEAIAKVAELRKTEGARIAEHLAAGVRTMRTLAQEMRAHQLGVVQAQRDRLRARVEELLAGTGVSAGGEQLEREVAYLAERSDVTEELNRVDSHLEEVTTTLGQNGPVGRKLDFVAQELGRESNTIGAKAADTEVASLVLAFRQEVERMREQVANVE